MQSGAPLVPRRDATVRMSLPMYWLYSALLALGLLVTLPYWLLHMLRHGKYRSGLAERLGKVPQRLRIPEAAIIWVHAVSVGEVLAVSRLITEMGADRKSTRLNSSHSQ